MPVRQAPHTIGKEHAVWAADVKRRARYECEKCGSRDNLIADHIVEVIDGGTFDLNNGQCLCKRCHVKKTNRERAKRAAERLST